jgi:hypothetical protein
MKALVWSCVLFVALSEEPGFYLVSEWQRDFNGTLSTDCSADVLNEFFSSSSLGFDGEAGDGIDLQGNYVVGGKVVKHCGLGRTEDPNAQTGMNRWPLTFAAGHPYYEDSTWGELHGGSWKSFVASVATPIIFAQPPAVTKQSVLVVENLGGSSPRPLLLTGSKLEFAGIVIRKGGILLVDDVNLSLRVQFVTVESGGLLQAGSHHDDGYRFMAQLTITLVHSTDYSNTPVTASQYSAEVLHPGVTLQGPGSDFVDFTNSGPNNFGGAKAIAVFFNGNYQLNGFVPSAVNYKSTWNAVEVEVDASASTPPTDWHTEIQPPTTRTAKDMHNQDLRKWPSSYPMVWARLRTPGAVSGATVVALEADDYTQASLLQGHTWAPGDKILLTAKTSQYTDTTQGIGMPRVWMDHADNTQDHADNTAANTQFKLLMGGHQDGEVGVEVATIASIDPVLGTISLMRPLKFSHGSEDTPLENERGRKLHVQTRLHIGWLSRRITITSERTDGGGGCNNVKSTAKAPTINGAMGELVPNFSQASTAGSKTNNVWIDSSDEIYGRCYNRSRRQGPFAKPYKDGKDGFFDTVFTGPQTATHIPRGHWMFGTAGKNGCNAIWGGQQKFRYGSSVSLDGVEVTHMGTPGRLQVYLHTLYTI